MFFRFGKKEGFHTHRQKKKKKKTPDRQTLIFFLRYDKQTYFFMPYQYCYLGQKKRLLYWRNPTDPKIRPGPTFFF